MANPSKKKKHSVSTPMDVDGDQTPRRKTPRGRRGAPDTSLLDEVYMTVKIVLKASKGILNDLRSKLVILMETAQEADPTVVIPPVNPEVTGIPLQQPEDVPTTFTSILKYFDTTNKLLAKGGTMWCTAKLAFSGDVEDLLNRTSYDLEKEGISLNKKRLQLFKTATPGYLLFIKNTLDTDDIATSITSDLTKIQKDSVPELIVYNKEPWEGFKKERKGRKQAQWSRAFHFECDRGEKGALETQVRHWIKSGAAAKRYGENIRYIEAVHSRTSANQKERTQRMNVQGQRFQASVATTILVGLINPDREISVKGDKRQRTTKTVRELILERKTQSGLPIFISVTKKWNSADYEGAYATKTEALATDFAECPCAFLRFELGDAVAKEDLYKAFDNEAIPEASNATWDDDKKRAITAKEKADIADIEAAANTEWFVDINEVDAPIEQGIPERPQQAPATEGDLEFDWNDGCSVSTCRTTGTVGTNASVRHTPRVLPHTSVPSSSATSTSDVTTESRLDSLENKLSRVLAALERSTPQSAVHGAVNPCDGALDSRPPLTGRLALRPWAGAAS